MTDQNGIDPQAYNNFGGTELPPYMPPYSTDNYMAPYPYSGGTGYAQTQGMDMPYGAPMSDKNPYGASPPAQDPYAPQGNYGAVGNPQPSSYYPPGYAAPQGQPSPSYQPYPSQAPYADPYSNYAPQPSYDWPAQQSDPYAPARFQADPYAPASPQEPWRNAEGYRAPATPQMPQMSQDQASSYYGAPASQGYRPAQAQAAGSFYEAGNYPLSSHDPQAGYAMPAAPQAFETPRFERRVFQASDIQRQQANSQQIYGYQTPQAAPPRPPYAETISRSMYPGAPSYPAPEAPHIAHPAAMPPMAAPPVTASPAEMPPAWLPSMAASSGMNPPAGAFPAMAPPMTAASVNMPPVMTPAESSTAVASPMPASSAGAAEQEPPSNLLFETPPAAPIAPAFSPDFPAPSAQQPAPSFTPPESVSESAPPLATVLEPKGPGYAPESPAPSAIPPGPMSFAAPPAAPAPTVYAAPGVEPAAPVVTQAAEDTPVINPFDFNSPPIDPTAFSTGGLSFSGPPPIDPAAVSIGGLSAPEMAPPAAPSPLEKNIFESNFTINPAQAGSATRQTQLGDTEIFRIAEELSQAVLVKSLNRAFNDNNLMPENGPPLVSVNQIFSDYYVSESGEQPYRMFEGLSFELRGGCCCILISDLALSAYALARSICESADKGGEGEPVTMAPLADGYPGQVMYIGSDSMLPDEMTCREFLLYTQGSGEEGPEVENERLAALFAQLGAGNLIDTDLRDLSYNKRILMLVLAATLNPNIICVVVNDPKFSVGSEEEMLARRIFALINNRGKCSMISCASDHLMAAVANRVAVVKAGRLLFFDSYRRFLDEYCLGIMTFSAENPQAIATELESRFPGINVLCKDNFVYVIRRKGSPETPLETLISDVIHLGIDYSTIVMDDKSFAVACKEAFGK